MTQKPLAADEPTRRFTPDQIDAKPTNDTPSPRVVSIRVNALPEIPGYRLTGELGRGGMGVVYRAVHLGLKRTVAIKMLPQDELIESSDMARFCSEAEAVAAIKHPNIVQVFEFSVHDSRPYMAMEILPGGSLAMKLRETAGRMPAVTAAALVEKLAGGVQAAHIQGIVHRDLKPGNVLFDPEGEPKVTDFGLAKRDSSTLTKTQEVMGTPAYMSPEQAGGRTKFTGPPSDIYALGAILYECLTGEAPFGKDGDSWSIIHRVIHDAPTRPRDHIADIPKDLELICLTCLEKDPNHRYLSAQALADDLQCFLNHEPVSVSPPNLLERSIKWARRRPMAALAYGLASVVACLLVVGAVIVAFWLNAVDAKRNTESANREILVEKTKVEEGRLQMAEANEKLQAQQIRLSTSLANETKVNDRLNATKNDLVETKYYHDVSLAYREFVEGNPLRADMLLEACPPERRGWEWWHCFRTIHPELLTFRAPETQCISFDATGGEIVFHGFNQEKDRFEMEFRDANTGKVLRRFPIGTKGSPNKYLSDDGRFLLETTFGDKKNPADAVLNLWDVRLGKKIRVWEGFNELIYFGAINSNGSVAIVSTDANLNANAAFAQAYDLNTGEKLGKLGHRSRFAAMQNLSGDGSLALTATTVDNQETLTAWNPKSGEVKQHFQFEYQVLEGALSFDGGQLVFVTANGSVGFWKVGQPKPHMLHSGAHTGIFFKIRFSPDGKWAVTTGKDGAIRLWKTATGELAKTYRSIRGKIDEIAFHPVSDRFLTRDEQGHYTVWPIGAEPVSQFALPVPGEGVSTVCDQAKYMFLPNLGDPRFTALCMRDNPNIALLEKNVTSTIQSSRFQPGGRIFATLSGGETVELRETVSGNLLQTLKLQPGSLMHESLCFSRNGERLLAASEKEAVVWDVKNNRKLSSAERSCTAMGRVAFSGDGKRFACIRFDGSVQIHGAEDGKPLMLVDRHEEIQALALNKNMYSPENCHSLALNYDGSQLAVGTDSWRIYLYKIPANPPTNITTRKAERVIFAHSATVTALAYSHNGERIASGSDDGNLKIFNPGNGLEAIGLKLPKRSPVTDIQYTHDGNRIIATTRQFGAFVFDGKPKP